MIAPAHPKLPVHLLPVFLLPAVTFASAAAVLALEIAIVRLGAPYVGQALAPWSGAIVCVLLGLTLGHMLGGLVGGRQATTTRLRSALAIAWFFAGLTTLAVPLLVGPIVRYAEAGGSTQFLVAALSALVFPASVAAGLSLPVALRLCVALTGGAIPGRLATILAASAIGSVAGTAMSGFVLLESVGAVGLARTIAWLWLILALVILPWAHLTRGVSLVALAPVAVGAWLTSLPPSGKTCWTETRYTCIQIVETTPQSGGLLRFMMLDEGLHSVSDRDDARRLHLGYAGVVDALARKAFAASSQPRALVIGGGGATLPRAWAQATPPVETVVAELDRRVAAEAADMMWADSARIRTIVGDGRAALRSLKQEPVFDVVLMDAYRSHSVPPHLVSREFDAEVARQMAKSGVFLSNVIDRADTLHLVASIAATLQRAFPVVDVWLTEVEGGMTNAVIAAWPDAGQAMRPDTLNVEASLWEAGETVRRETIVWRRVDAAEMARRHGACAAVLSDDWASVDRLLAGRSSCDVPLK